MRSPSLFTTLSLRGLACVGLLFTSIHAHGADDLVIADFEGDTYGGWKTTGDAFGAGPVHGTLPNQQIVKGVVGKGFASSLHNGDAAIGTLTSPGFKIERRFINFLIGGGGFARKTCLNLLIDGKVVRTATGSNTFFGGTETLAPQAWDVSELAGKQAVLEVVDQAKGKWGYIHVDQIVQSDTRAAKAVLFLNDCTRKITVTHSYLHLPMKSDIALRRLTLLVDGTAQMPVEMQLADSSPDWWTWMDVKAFKGKEIMLKVDRLPDDSTALSAIEQLDEIKNAADLYHEKYRPQFHFSARFGWLNDPVGLVFYKDEYHLGFQHNPYGFTMGVGQWGHAVSLDLVHWKELDDTLCPGDERGIYSGSGVVDWGNTSGLGKDGQPPLVFIYTAAKDPRTQYLAYSLDGRTFTKYSGNPVLKSIARGNRDPKVTWHAGTKRWVMALFLDKNDYGLFTSPDLKQWTQVQTLTLPECAECPDFFPMPTADKATTWAFVAANGRYLIGDFDGAKFTYEGQAQRVDFGNSCYAVQTFSDTSDGRRIQIGWMNGEHYPNMPYSQQMSFPCALTLHNTDEGQRLFKYPVAEIAKLHRNSKTWKDVSLAPGENLLKNITGELFDISAEFEIGDATDLGFTVRGTAVHYDVKGKRLIGLGATAMPSSNGRIKLRMLVDRTSLEVYGNDGQVAMTNRWLPKEGDRSLEIFAKGGTAKIVSLEVHELESAWR